MTSEGPAPLLPRSGGGEALAFVFAQDHRRQRDWRPRRQSPVRTALRIGDFRLHLNRPTPTPRVASGDWNPSGADTPSSGPCGRDDHGDDA